MQPAKPFDKIDGYRLIREIGRGGFGVVWLCQNETLGEFHALKWLWPRSHKRGDFPTVTEENSLGELPYPA